MTSVTVMQCIMIMTFDLADNFSALLHRNISKILTVIIHVHTHKGETKQPTTQ